MKEKFRENLSAIIILLLEAAVGVLLLIDPVAFAGTAGEERCFHCGGNLKNGYGAGTPGASFTIGANRDCGSNPSVTASPCPPQA